MARLGQFQQVNFHLGSVGVSRDARGIHISIWLVLLIAGLRLTAYGGVLIGLPTLRLRGDYLAIVTLGFGEIIPQFVRNADSLHGFDLTHGTFGISPIDSPGFGTGLHNAVGLPSAYSQEFTADRLFFWTAFGDLDGHDLLLHSLATRASAGPVSRSARTRPPPARWASR